jgi:hypothetical protein
MPYSNNIENVTLKAAADMSGMQFHVVSQDGSGEGVLASAGGGFGIVQNHPNSGEAATVAVYGQSKAIAGGTLDEGDLVRAVASGWVIAVASGAAHPNPTTVIGECMFGAASGDITTIDIRRNVLSINSGDAF